MTAILLSCPNCGAPLSHLSASKARGDLWPCIHCGALLRVASGASPVLDRQVAPDVTARLRQLVLEGKRDEAERVAMEAGLPKEMVEQLKTEVFTGILFSQKLTWVGVLMFLASLGVLAGGVGIVQLGYGLGWILVVLGGLYPLPLIPLLITTIRMALLPSGVATIRRATHLGTRPGRPPVAIYAFDVAIEATSGAPAVEGSLLVPVREASLSKAVPGTRIVVRYSPSDPSFIRFDRMA